MGTPLPLEGENPYTGMYQSRQVGAGYLNTWAPIHVSDYLANPPTALLDAEAVTPLTEEAAFFDLDVQTVTVTGSPASGTFALQYSTDFTSALAYNASAATVETALQGLGAPLAAVTVTGSAGGPWTVTGFTGAGSTPLQLLRTRNVQLPGDANVVVTTTGGQQGIIPF